LPCADPLRLATPSVARHGRAFDRRELCVFVSLPQPTVYAGGFRVAELQRLRNGADSRI